MTDRIPTEAIRKNLSSYFDWKKIASNVKHTKRKKDETSWDTIYISHVTLYAPHAVGNNTTIFHRYTDVHVGKFSSWKEKWMWWQTCIYEYRSPLLPTPMRNSFWQISVHWIDVYTFAFWMKDKPKGWSMGERKRWRGGGCGKRSHPLQTSSRGIPQGRLFPLDATIYNAIAVRGIKSL